MKKYNLTLLLLIQALALTFILSIPVILKGDEMQTFKGTIVCIEVDKNGEINPIEDFNVCNGLLVFVGIDNKIYTLSGEEEVIYKISKNPKRRMGYRTPLKMKGSVEGNQRAWILHAQSREPMKPNEVEKTTVTGTIVCIVPNYTDGDAEPVVAVGPCNKYAPHMHVIYNQDGQIYALHGTEESIVIIENRPDRKNVQVTGAITGNKCGWILFVD